jgi:murein L,D-transpeptidase YafK
MLMLYTATKRAHPRTIAPNILALTLALWTWLGTGCNAAAEPLYPTALMNWMVEGSFHALIVDKSQQRLMVWKTRDGEPTLVESFRCSTGESEGDKWIRGDMKTPEGVYFFCSIIDGLSLPVKYGLWAFTTDYPNFVDRRRGKSGDGIWLHGRDKPLGSKPDSNGCIALENHDLIRVSRYIRLQSTPLIVVEKLHMAPRSLILQQERELRDFIEDWRQAWESQDLEAYMERYSRNFQSCWLDYAAWKEKKRKLSERYKTVRVRLGTVYLYRQNGLVTSIFTQEYRSESYRSSGIKVLYMVHDSKYRIYSEDYHKPVDDPFPVVPLLSRVGADPGTVESEGKELSIRLVSTDEPDVPIGELETPRPSAPSRAVVLEKMGVSKESPPRQSRVMRSSPRGSLRRDLLWHGSSQPTCLSGPSCSLAVPSTARPERYTADLGVLRTETNSRAVRRDRMKTAMAALPER